METEAEVFRNSSDWLTLSLKSEVKIKRFNEAEKKKLQQVESIDKPSLVVIDLQQPQFDTKCETSDKCLHDERSQTEDCKEGTLEVLIELLMHQF